MANQERNVPEVDLAVYGRQTNSKFLEQVIEEKGGRIQTFGGNVGKVENVPKQTEEKRQ